MTLDAFRLPVEPPPDCRAFAERRGGKYSRGVFHRLGVSPDGSRVVFEITDDFAYADFGNPSATVPRLTDQQKGFFSVLADGTGVCRHGDASRDKSFRQDRTTLVFDSRLPFSPDGETIAFTDQGCQGEDPVQIFTLDLATGHRTQVTHLSRTQTPAPSLKAIQYVGFTSRTRIIFLRYVSDDGNIDLQLFGVTANGMTEAKQLDNQFNLPGVALSALRITGGVTQLVQGDLSNQEAVNHFRQFPDEKITREIFVLRGKKEGLQLTGFRRSDTGFSLYRIGQRVFFTASADMNGENPSENCQLFSVDTLGGNLRQLTKLRASVEPSGFGCYFGFPPGCFVQVGFEALTATALWYSDCNPLGTNPDKTVQFFAGRADATRLRQLTRMRGAAGPGAVSVELIGQFGFAGGGG